MKFWRMSFSETITFLCEMQVHIPKISLLVFAYFSEMMNYVIGLVGLKFSPSVSKGLTYFRLNLVCMSIDRNDSIKIRYVLFFLHIFHVCFLKLMTYKED